MNRLVARVTDRTASTDCRMIHGIQSTVNSGQVHDSAVASLSIAVAFVSNCQPRRPFPLSVSSVPAAFRHRRNGPPDHPTSSNRSPTAESQVKLPPTCRPRMRQPEHIFAGFPSRSPSLWIPFRWFARYAVELQTCSHVVVEAAIRKGVPQCRYRPTAGAMGRAQSLQCAAIPGSSVPSLCRCLNQMHAAHHGMNWLSPVNCRM